jgi:hypothetical protein
MRYESHDIGRVFGVLIIGGAWSQLLEALPLQALSSTS